MCERNLSMLAGPLRAARWGAVSLLNDGKCDMWVHIFRSAEYQTRASPRSYSYGENLPPNYDSLDIIICLEWDKLLHNGRTIKMIERNQSNESTCHHLWLCAHIWLGFEQANVVVFFAAVWSLTHSLSLVVQKIVCASEPSGAVFTKSSPKIARCNEWDTNDHMFGHNYSLIMTTHGNIIPLLSTTR